MNKVVLWILRTLGLFGCFWFFFWAFTWEMVKWQKPSPDPLNTALLAASLILATLPNFTQKTKPKPPKKSELQKLQDQIHNAKTPKQKQQAKQKMIDYLKEQKT